MPAYSQRFPWDAPQNAMTRLLADMRRAEIPVTDLTVSNPTMVELPLPEAEILAPLADPEILRHLPYPRGPLAARKAIADYYLPFQAKVTQEQILVTCSTSESYAHLFRLLGDPGDAFLVPRPSYPLFDFLAGAEGVELLPYPLNRDGQWHIDLAALEAAITPRTRAILLVNPNNPTGSYVKTGERDRLRELCRRHDLALIVDEVFTDYPLDCPPDAVRTFADESEVLTFVLSGLSKVCALPQMKIGWIVVAGPAAMRQQALQRLDLISDSFLSVSAPSLAATPTWLAMRDQLQAPLHQRLRDNLESAREILHNTGAQALAMEGGWYLVIRLPATRSDEEWALDLLQKQHVLLHPGYLYDFATGAYLIGSLLMPCRTFRHGIRSLRNFVNIA